MSVHSVNDMVLPLLNVNRECQNIGRLRSGLLPYIQLPCGEHTLALENGMKGPLQLSRVCSPWYCEVCFAAVQVPWRQLPGVLHAEVELLRCGAASLLWPLQVRVALHREPTATPAESTGI